MDKTEITPEQNHLAIEVMKGKLDLVLVFQGLIFCGLITLIGVII